MNPVQNPTICSAPRPNSFRAAARSSSEGGANRSTSIPHRIRRTRSRRNRSSRRRRWYASEKGTTVSKLAKLASRNRSYSGRFGWYVGAEIVSGTGREAAVRNVRDHRRHDFEVVAEPWEPDEHVEPEVLVSGVAERQDSRSDDQDPQVLPPPNDRYPDALFEIRFSPRTTSDGRRATRGRRKRRYPFARVPISWPA